MKMKKSDSYTVQIHIAGDYPVILGACRRFAARGIGKKEASYSFNLKQADFVFPGGMESGATVEIINYPRFTTTAQNISSRAIELAKYLIFECSQLSATITEPEKTILVYREEKF